MQNVTRDRMTRLAAANTHTENDKQAIRALERRLKKSSAANRVKTPVPTSSSSKKTKSKNTKTPPPAPRSSNNGRAGLQNLPPHLFLEKIAPQLAARNLAALQRAGKTGKAFVGNALQNDRFANQKTKAELVRRLRQVFASGIGRELKKPPTRKAFLQLQKQGWDVPNLKAERMWYGGGADPVWKKWYGQNVIKTVDGTAITVTVRWDSIHVEAWNNGKAMGNVFAPVDGFNGRKWSLLRDKRLPLDDMIEDAFRTAGAAEGVQLYIYR